MESEIGGPSGFREVGFTILAGENEFEALRKNVEMQRSIGIETRIITPEELKEIEPHINTEGIAGAAYEPKSGYADPVTTAQSFAKAAEGMGCKIMVKTRVIGFELDKNLNYLLFQWVGRCMLGLTQVGRHNVRMPLP